LKAREDFTFNQTPEADSCDEDLRYKYACIDKVKEHLSEFVSTKSSLEDNY